MDKSSKVILGISFSLITIVAFLIVALQSSGEQDIWRKRCSTFFTEDSGAKAIYLVLGRFIPTVERYRRPFQSLDDQVSTLIVQDPTISLTVKEASALEEWISEGGQLILAVDEEWVIADEEEPKSLFEQMEENLDIEIGDDDEESEEEFGILAQEGFSLEHIDPDDISKMSNGPILDLKSELTIAGHDAMVSHNGFTQVALASLGAGRILVIPDSNVFSNGRLRESSNAVWLAQICAEWGDSVYFDEYHHGFVLKKNLGDTVMAFLFSPWGIGFLQLFLAGFLILAGPWRRFGSIIEVRQVQHHDPLELINARAHLFRKAGARIYGLRMIHGFLLERLAHFGMYAVRDVFSRNPDHKGNSPQLARYLALNRKMQEDQKLTEAEFVEAADLSGKLLEEYYHE